MLCCLCLVPAWARRILLSETLREGEYHPQHDPTFEWLFEVDVESGGRKPWLAARAEMAQDGRSWWIALQPGAPFHRGYGEFTARDVVHSHALWCDPHYPGRKDPTTTAYEDVGRPPADGRSGAG